TVIAPALVDKSIRSLRTRRIVVALSLGVILLLCWWIPEKIVMHSSNVVPDTGGIDEALHRLIISDFAQLGRALLLPALVLLYAMPVSLALIFPLHPGLRKLYEPRRARLLLILAVAVFVSFGIDVISGMNNP